MNELKGIVNEIVENNGWLSGVYDFKDGDIMAIVNQPEKFQEVVEKTDLKELHNDLKNYDGVYKYKNLLFFNDWRYGTFVYDINSSNRKDYIEHLTMNAMTFEHFRILVNDLTK